MLKCNGFSEFEIVLVMNSDCLESMLPPIPGAPDTATQRCLSNILPNSILMLQTYLLSLILTIRSIQYLR